MAVYWWIRFKVTIKGWVLCRICSLDHLLEIHSWRWIPEKSLRMSTPEEDLQGNSRVRVLFRAQTQAQLCAQITCLRGLCWVPSSQECSTWHQKCPHCKDSNPWGTVPIWYRTETQHMMKLVDQESRLSQWLSAQQPWCQMHSILSSGSCKEQGMVPLSLINLQLVWVLTHLMTWMRFCLHWSRLVLSYQQVKETLFLLNLAGYAKKFIKWNQDTLGIQISMHLQSIKIMVIWAQSQQVSPKGRTDQVESHLTSCSFFSHQCWKTQEESCTKRLQVCKITQMRWAPKLMPSEDRSLITSGTAASAPAPVITGRPHLILPTPLLSNLGYLRAIWCGQISKRRVSQIINKIKL